MSYKIYIIKNNINDNIYIGSTTKDNLKHRLYQHILSSIDENKSGNHGKLIRAMREICDENFTIELIESIECNNLSELRHKEGYWIRYYESWVDEKGYNTRVEGRTKKEYYNDTKEHTISRVKNYCENNKGKVADYKKQHYEEHKEHIQNYKKEWYLNRKDTHNLKAKERITCECGANICRGALQRHIQTEKHKKAMTDYLSPE